MSVKPPPGGLTRADQITYYTNILAQLPGTYQGNYKQYDGTTWADLYRTLAGANPAIDPGQLADAVLGVEAAQRVGKGVQAAGNGLGTFIKQAEQGAANTDFAAGVPGASALSGITDFLGRLTEGSLWIRVAEAVLGIALVVVGLAKITNAIPVATKIAGAIK